MKSTLIAVGTSVALVLIVMAVYNRLAADNPIKKIVAGA